MAFDPYDQNSWYFAELSRSQAIEILNREPDIGVFLVRNSSSISENGETKFRIGENTFCDLPTLLTFYKHHYLDTTPLIKTASKKLHYVRAKFDFLGNDSDDLPFKKNEILTVISKQEVQWWTAKNDKGETGVIPVPYVETIEEDEYFREKNLGNISNLSSSGSANSSVIPNGSAISGNINDSDRKFNNNSSPKRRSSLDSSQSSVSVNSILSTENKSVTGTSNGMNSSLNGSENGKSVTNYNRKLPARAMVVQQRIPNAYDKKALKLDKGDIILVTATNINGQWEGELNGKAGHFPFNYVKFIEEESQES